MTATLDSTADGILVVDNEGVITGFNGRFSEIWQIPEKDVSPGRGRDALAFVLEQLANAQSFLTTWRDLVEHPEIETFDSLEFKDGRVVELYSKPQKIEGEIVGRVWSFRDATDRTRLEDELEYRAFHDPLTGLANKALYQDRLEHALARKEQSGSQLAVLFIDLDDFKTVNDSLGHGEGDVCSSVWRRRWSSPSGPSTLQPGWAVTSSRSSLRTCSRATTSRTGRTHPRGAAPVVLLGSKAVSPAGSVGIAFDDEGITSEQLLRNADIAMYKAKESGKTATRSTATRCTHWCWRASSSRTSCVQRSSAGTCSPTTSRSSTCGRTPWSGSRRWCAGTIHGAAWSTPASFVSIAEEMGLVGEIDTFVLRCRLPAGLRVARRRPRRSRFRHERQRLGRPAGRPEIGRCVLADVAAVRLRPVVADHRDHRERDPHRERGDRAQPDDAAPARASASRWTTSARGSRRLAHLDRLKVDIVKIDKSFVQALGTKDDTR